MEKRRITATHIFLSALIGAFAALGMVFTPVLMLLPAFMAFVSLVWGAPCAAVAYIFSAVSIYAINGSVAGTLYMAVMYVPGSVILTVMLKRRAAHRASVAMLAAAFALGLYAMLCLPSLLAGGGPFDMIYEYTDMLSQNASDVASRTELAAAGSISLYLKTIRSYIPQVVIIFVIGGGMFMGFFDHIIAFSLLKRAGCPVRAMAPFKLWNVSNSFTLGALILLLGSASVSFFGIANAEAISSAAQIIVLAPFTLTGISTCEFLMSPRPNRGLLRFLCYGALALLLPYSIFSAAILGLVDRMFKLRKRRMNIK